MTITIHRGTHQIGGCITEIRTDSTRIIIDLGAELPDNDTKNTPASLDVTGVTQGVTDCAAVFFTHYHGDHIGLISRILPSVPIYMGETAKEIYQAFCRQTNNNGLTAVESTLTYRPAEPIQIGDITVTPFLIDHSAFDAYMFLIEANGKRVLHTGDFRIHGFRGSKTFKMLECYVGQVDWLICEGTTLSRVGEKPMTERKLQTQARQIMLKNKRVFVLCSSTNIDRIAAFYHAIPDSRPMVCDNYQKELLDIVRERHGAKTSLYDFEHVYSYGKNLEKLMDEKGFCMLIRANSWSRHFIEKYKGDSIIVYSMWLGYLEGHAKNQYLVDFLKPYTYHELHTSGHASSDDLKKIYSVVNPRCGLIPIHCEAPELFTNFLPNAKIAILNDGEAVEA